MSDANFFEFTMSHARLAVLRALVETPGYAANDSILTDVMLALGLPVSRDLLRTQLGWLEEQGLIRLVRPTASLIVATLCERGLDIATGRARMDGVARPTPAR